ncbi:hypothetical protein HJFPF1_03797 [Paramyrothecium foliicola]|nr:hypothetical protein HJFPF1_03797 [Paramyrothecium foliicola]
MFRFWGSESWGSDKNADATAPFSESEAHQLCDSPTATPSTVSDLQSFKKRRLDSDATDGSLSQDESVKRVKLAPTPSDDGPLPCDSGSRMSTATPSVETARDVIKHQFGLEILLKHKEIRLIDQELAKCQIALEQLRRCHLIPYPVNCPTPEQMMNVSAGKGFALQTKPGDRVPKWAPPFGVVEGPYARHYARWLIPDPAFDGVEPEPQFLHDTLSRTSTVEGRATRNSATDSGAPRGRSARGSNSRHLQALPSGYTVPKEKPLYCTVKRSDGITVKLVCVDCDRSNFSSTQGFINHCRIAHKRDYKSHEEAAVHCGKPIDAATPVEEKPVPLPSATTDLVHPFAQAAVSDKDVYKLLQSRIADSRALLAEDKLPGFTSEPSSSASPVKKTVTNSEPSRTSNFHGAPETPFLSEFLANRSFNGDLAEIVTDARTPLSLEDITPDDDSEDVESAIPLFDGTSDSAPVRTQVMMRMPARTAPSSSPAPQGSASCPVGAKGRAPHLSFVPPPASAKGMIAKDAPTSILSDEDIDMEDANLSPHTLVSNNAPSLVSDDGEYDDSDEGSSVSGADDAMDADSVSDMAEITLDDEHDPRALRRGSSGVSGSVPLRKDEPKHVTFISPVKGSAKERRPHKA